MTEPQALATIDAPPLAAWEDPTLWDQLMRVSSALARTQLLPAHLRGSNQEETTANCLLVVEQAHRWGMSPFALVGETYVIGGNLGYQGKLVAAVINTRAGLEDRLSYEFSGKGDDLICVCSGTFKGTGKTEQVAVKLGDVVTFEKSGKRKAMWSRMPEQKLSYGAAIKWARRHAPEIMLGVATVDDLDLRTGYTSNVTPAVSASAALDAFAATPVEVEETPQTLPLDEILEAIDRIEKLAKEAGLTNDELDDMALSLNGIKISQSELDHLAAIEDTLLAILKGAEE